MLSKLSVKNIKCFHEQDFNFSNLNILCGANSAGKSTAIQCLLLLRQNYNKTRFSNHKIELMGEYFSFGHLSDFQNHNSLDSTISISVDDIKFDFDAKESNSNDYHINIINKSDINHHFFTNDFIYLCAERLGPRNSFDVNYDSSKIDIGIFGEYAMSEFAKRADDTAINQDLAIKILDQPVNTEKGSSHQSITLRRALNKAMERIFPNFDIESQSVQNIDKVTGSFTKSGVSKTVRPVNTGFGISYIFPIFVAALSINKGGILIIENPEVHLHPKAQSLLANFLSLTAQSGIQIILETHSDHIINGTLISLKNQILKPENIKIYHLDRTEKDQVNAIEVPINSKGMIKSPPAGFFDQITKDIITLVSR